MRYSYFVYWALSSASAGLFSSAAFWAATDRGRRATTQEMPTRALRFGGARRWRAMMKSHRADSVEITRCLRLLRKLVGTLDLLPTLAGKRFEELNQVFFILV